LLSGGKPFKIALIAVMSELIRLMDHLLKNPDFDLAHGTPSRGCSSR